MARRGPRHADCAIRNSNRGTVTDLGLRRHDHPRPTVAQRRPSASDAYYTTAT